MPGWLSNNVPALTVLTGNEQASFDTEAASGANPQTGALSLTQLASALSYYSANISETLVAGSRYFTQVNVGTPITLNGLQVLIGGTGGTDKWLVELHSSTGALLATSALAGATVGTANTWQQFAFTSAYNIVAGTYYLAVQTNGTTATLAAINSPTYPLFTGSATGTFGTSASITPPTAYTAGVGPRMLFY